MIAIRLLTLMQFLERIEGCVHFEGIVDIVARAPLVIKVSQVIRSGDLMHLG